MSFSDQILNWYRIERRDLPWRETDDPYLIWISEVILQQTRIDQGLSYYMRFAEKYPNVKMLASAPEEEVLKLWQGLGYYSRARNMLFAAKQIIEDHKGTFPDHYASLRTLKGVGDYTAAAIASIAFNEAVAVVDGNVKRVISRIFGLKETGNALHMQVKKVMMDLIDKNTPGDFNQAVMEFGATHCTPRKPGCADCIFKDNCYAFTHNMTASLPVKDKIRKPKEKYFYYLVIEYPVEPPVIIIKKRKEKGIWKNMYDFPLFEFSKEQSVEDLIDQEFKKLFNGNVNFHVLDKTYDHQLTHRSIKAKFFHVVLGEKENIELHDQWEWVSKNKIASLPLPRLIDRFINDHPEIFRRS